MYTINHPELTMEEDTAFDLDDFALAVGSIIDIYNES